MTNQEKTQCKVCGKRKYERGQTYTPGDECQCPTPSLSEGEEWKETHDFKQAVYAANKYLDEPYLDPDGDECTISRQFLRMVERYDALSQTRANDIERMVAIGEELVQRPNADKEHICRFNDGEQCCDCYNAAILKYQQKIKSLE